MDSEKTETTREIKVGDVPTLTPDTRADFDPNSTVHGINARLIKRDRGPDVCRIWKSMDTAGALANKNWLWELPEQAFNQMTGAVMTDEDAVYAINITMDYKKTKVLRTNLDEVELLKLLAAKHGLTVSEE